ncbi:His Kinase A (phospho-acceptor) domain-containing protein [Algoriphagus boritolerans DSM 17298 = JCM 18970]|uniref:histidine kinase n=2 Tax=Algoriphagus TaxID=246875 RepID=A0A1H5WKA7_9BACT|nr:His Kinase A (phospho-acceptor) domain-containing protein [Algoriphagus boritolerans DSM 17298 = JCM 18970]
MDDIRKIILSTCTIEKEVQTLDGRWYQMMAIPYVKQHDNQNDGVIITFNDITELKKVQNKLSRINADHDTFIYAVSHDLRGPLANLFIIISMLKETLKSYSDIPFYEDTKELIMLIDKSTTNLNTIINELSDLAKIEGDIDLKEKVNVEELFEEVELSMKEKLLSSKAQINYDLREPVIEFSKKNLRSILFNILSNAIKYSSSDRTPEIWITTEKLGDYTLLSIQDNGIGISEDQQKNIFGAFRRAHNHVEGTGIGLYLVKKTVTNAGGDIELESEVDKGSTFKVYFRNDPEEGYVK